MKFKLFCVICSLIPILVLCGGFPSFMQNVQECRNETNATQEEFINVMRHEVPETTGEECLLACVQKKMGLMAADNKANLDKILQSIDHVKNFDKDRYEKLKKIYEDCTAAEVVEKDQCTAAKKFAECVWPKERALGPPAPPPHWGPPPSDHWGAPPGSRGPPPGQMGPPPGHRRPPHGPGPIEFRYMEQCKNKSGASPNEVHNVMRREIPKTKNEQCLLACIQKNMEFIGEDNKINIEKIKYRFRMMKENNPNMFNRTLQMYTECQEKETAEKDECVAAQKFAECVFPKEKMNRLPPVMRRYVQECKNKTSATDVEIYTSIIANEIPKTKGESCMLACAQKKMGAMNADNTIAIEKITNNFRHLKLHDENLYNKSIKILDDCKTQETKEEDECVAARKFAACIIPKENEMSIVRPGP